MSEAKTLTPVTALSSCQDAPRTGDAPKRRGRGPTVCPLCNTLSVQPLLELGPQPISNRYLASPAGTEFLHDLTLGYCERCELAQLVNPVPARELLPPYGWVTYNEPERHLDQLVSILASLPGLAGNAAVGAVSFKDDTTLERLAGKGFGRTWRIREESDLGITAAGAGVETVQQRLTPELAGRVAARYGKADLLIVRHIAEHAHDIRRFTDALKELCHPDAYLVLEVPDCSRAFANHDFTTLWEEHPIYFTPDSFRRCLETCGFRVERLFCYPYAFEDSLVAIVKRGDAASLEQHPGQREQFTAFAAAFRETRRELNRFLADFTARQGRGALFGAGHLACTYLNVFRVAGRVSCVIDDSPQKKGLFMPGSRLPIVGASALMTEGIRLCLLGVSPEVEDRVMERNRHFADGGGIFASIFPGSSHALRFRTGVAP